MENQFQTILTTFNPFKLVLEWVSFCLTQSHHHRNLLWCLFGTKEIEEIAELHFQLYIVSKVTVYPSIWFYILFPKTSIKYSPRTHYVL